MQRITKNNIKYNLIRRRGQKSLRLRIDPRTLELIASTNLSTPDKDVDDFVDENKDWYLSYIQTRKPQKHSYQSGELFDCLGKKLELVIFENQKKNSYQITETQVILFLTIQDPPQELISAFLREAFKPVLRDYLKQRIAYWSREMRINYETSVVITDTKRNWASCNPSKRQLRFSIKTISVPLECIDYLVVHELSHYFQQNHGMFFWARVERYMPEYLELKRKLSENYFASFI